MWLERKKSNIINTEGMRVTYLTSEFITESNSFDGGLSNYLYKAAKGLINFGHQPIVIVSSNENRYLSYKGIDVYRVKPEPNIFYKIADKLSQYKYQVGLDILLQSYYLNKKLKEIHKNRPIDLVQFPSHQAIGLFVPNKIRSAMRISGYQKLADPANSQYFRTIKERQWQILEHRTYKKAKHIFGPSHFLAKKISNEFKKDVSVIETPFEKIQIDNDYHILNKINKKTKGLKYGLFFGRLAPIKGIIDVANMLTAFLTKYPKYYFVIIGKDVGYKGRPTLDYIIEKAGEYKNRIIYFREQPHEKLMPVIKNADFVVMPSRIENFPNACVEAMALNKIVIATRGVSFEQLINDKVNGFLCENANPNDLLRVIEEVINLPKENLAAVEQNAGKTVERLHPDITVKKLIAYYESILKK